MQILIVDGQGGKLASEVIKTIKKKVTCTITAVGTNAIATENMLKAGADIAATGENPVIVACRKADVIIGPIGIVIADALNGEITPNIAKAIGSADATRILIPINRCDNLVAGINAINTKDLINDAVNKLMSLIDKN